MFLDSNMDYYKNKSPASSNGNDNDSDSSSSTEEEENKIRVGKDYQAVVPDLIPESERNSEEYLDKALLVWSPTYQISDLEVDDYIHLAKNNYGYNGEQALGMLFWHKHDLQQAMNDLANFTPFPEEWTPEDKALFEQAFQFHGKNFYRIRQMLPEKSIPTLVKYYYSWKKTKSRTSLMDRQARKLAITRNNNATEEGAAPTSDHGSEGGSNTDSDSDDKKWIIHRGIRRESGSPPRQSLSGGENSKDDTSNGGQKQNNTCVNCGVLCNETHSTAKGLMCRTCALHFKKTGNPRPTFGPARGRAERHHVLPRNKCTPPRGMYINHDDLIAIASGSETQPDYILKSMDRELLTLKRIVQNNKQSISLAKNRTSKGVETYKRIINAHSNHRVCPTWSNEEVLLAVQAIRNFGKDFQAIADIVGTKTKAHVKSFYTTNRKRFNLDLLLQDHQRNFGGLPGRSKPAKNAEATDMDVVEEISSDSEDVDDPDPVPNPNSSPSSPLSNINNSSTTFNEPRSSSRLSSIGHRRRHPSVHLEKRLPMQDIVIEID
ncbi:REST corepressor 1 isoform X2 [Planococcus citri]|uniref:REST corepressor 1 isoform X2 n=1 Tax=Planococcus citri TaxID=170843 RepID=UPI0031F8C4BA